MPFLAFGNLLMGAVRMAARYAAAMLAACVLIMAVFPGHQAMAKGKSLKDQLKAALVGQVVTSRILLGNRARPRDVARQGLTIDFPVHTLVDAETGEIAYRVEDPLWLEWAKVDPSEMLRSFDPGTSFRISSVHLKDNRLEIKLKQLGGKSAEVKLLMGKGWQSRYGAAAVEASLARVFAFGQPSQQPTMAQQAQPPVKSDVPVSGEAPPATPGVPVQGESQSPGGTGQVSLPADSEARPERPEPANQPVMRPAYVDCYGLKQVHLFPTPQASSPIAELDCGEKVAAMGEQNGRVRVRTGQGVEGYVSNLFLAYGEPPVPDRATGEQPTVPEGQNDTPAAATATSADGSAAQGPPAQETDQQPSGDEATAGQDGIATGSSGWSGLWPLLVAGCFGLLLVGLALRTSRKHDEQQRMYDEQREAERRKQKRKEDRVEDQTGNASASANCSYVNVAAQFKDLAKTCGPQIAEMARAKTAVGGVDFKGKGPEDFLFFDAVIVLSTVSKTKETVPDELTGLCWELHDRLNPRFFTWWALDDARRESFKINLPFTVTLLTGYDQVQGTRLAERAAEAYWALVCAACEIMDSKSGVATKIVRDRYLEFFRPYLPAGGDGRASSEEQNHQTAGPDNGTSGFGECLQCTKSYEALDVEPSASREEIKTAYRDLAKIFHSDRLQGSEERVRQKAEEKLKEINLAYEHISSHWKSQEG
jgi:DnaJ domain